MTAEVDVTAHHAETPLSTASSTVAAGSGIPFTLLTIARLTFVRVTFVLGQRHFIHSYMAIHLPASAKANVMDINHLIVLPFRLS
jgi:hypothetical protein